MFDLKDKALSNYFYILPVDCQLSDWKKDPCSVTCGKGIRKTTREKTLQEKNGGVCTGDLAGEEECNDKACPGKIILHITHYVICIIR